MWGLKLAMLVKGATGRRQQNYTNRLTQTNLTRDFDCMVEIKNIVSGILNSALFKVDVSYHITVCYVRTWYQWQGQVITSHRYCGVWLLVPALDTSSHTSPHITVICGKTVLCANTSSAWQTHFYCIAFLWPGNVWCLLLKQLKRSMMPTINN